MQLIQTLQNIVSLIQINAFDFFVSHPDYDYQPSTLSADVKAQVQKLPQDNHGRYLSLLLQNFLLDIYDGSLVRKKNQAVKAKGQFLENTAYLEVDWEFYEKLNQNNKGQGWWLPEVRVLRQEADGSLAVQKRDITLHIQRDRHLRAAEQSAVVGDLVVIRMLPSQIKGGLYVAIGNASGNLSSLRDSPHQAAEVFVSFNFSPAGAIAVMKDLTTRLNATEIPFRFMVLHNPSNYGIYDSGILRVERESYKLVRQLLQIVYTENKIHFQNQVPLFTKVLAPGLGLAEVPEAIFKSKDNFGKSRCQIVANALLEAHKNGDESSEARMKCILKHFENFGIDIERPYLNPNSVDIYTPLNLANGVETYTPVAE